jgi:hypothetical protein
MHDAFVVSLNAAGSTVLYSTYIGGSDDDYAMDIAVDSADNAYVVGSTLSADFPVFEGLPPSSGGRFDATGNAFVTQLGPNGRGAFSTLLGGTGWEEIRGVAVDASGNVWIAGRTDSTDFPTTPDALQRSFYGRVCDLTHGTLCTTSILAKISHQVPAGVTSLAYATYLDGNGGAPDGAIGVGLDGLSAVYVSGATESLTFPTTSGAFRTMRCCFSGDGFVVKLSSVLKPAPPFIVWNLALSPNAVASQSSTAQILCNGLLPTANRAVDGNTSGDWSKCSVTHTTGLEANAYWQVDLGSCRYIDHVKVWNRTDCCATRLQNYDLLVSDSPVGPWQDYYQLGVAGSPTTVQVKRYGRFVRVRQRTQDYLHLAEVEVFGY